MTDKKLDLGKDKADKLAVYLEKRGFTKAEARAIAKSDRKAEVVGEMIVTNMRARKEPVKKIGLSGHMPLSEINTPLLELNLDQLETSVEFPDVEQEPEYFCAGPSLATVFLWVIITVFVVVLAVILITVLSNYLRPLWPQFLPSSLMLFGPPAGGRAGVG